MTPSRRPFSWLSRLNPFAAKPDQAPTAAVDGPVVEAQASAAAASLTDSVLQAAAAAPESPSLESPTEVVFLPRDPQWGYCFWTLTAADRRRAVDAGATSLCLRLADVTGLDQPLTHPHALQELVVDGQANEWFLPVPLSGRDYRVELGYRLRGGGWLSLAFSAVARIPDLEPSAAIADAFVPFSLDGPTSPVAQPVSAGAVQHERLYRMATSSAQRLRRLGSEVLHEQDFAGQSERSASGAGLWASGRNESGSGIPRSRSFWLVADAELIVYGATEPTATVSIGDRVIPLSEDGGFRMHVPFPDGHQTYPIRAVAADGEQERSITLDFERRTPQARVNTREEAVQEWF
jgi:hypothetical protein